MTAEICMMNRLAVVLAADSATTVTRWVEEKHEERYFKGANKVFQLSNKHPIGLMIFDSADVLNIPWEIIIKSFRENLENKSFNTVEGYANELLDFLNNSQHFFPEEKQDEQLINAAKRCIFNLISASTKDVEEDDKISSVQEAFERKASHLADIAWPDVLDEPILQSYINRIRGILTPWIDGLVEAFNLPNAGNHEQWAEIALREVIKNPEGHFNTTGLVFAGFGDHEYLPAMNEYTHCGIISGKHLIKMKSNAKIDHDTPASISGFAQTSMTDTFTLGLSEDVYSSLMLVVSETFSELTDEIIASCGGGEINKADLIAAAKKRISHGVIDKARRDHSLPLRSVLSFLPVDEMAELAETLIKLQSLKEKVTKPSETVGGPIDVAIITKHEGFLWIKRKHFFNSDINSRYNLRQAAAHS